jgi:flagellar hook-length control protein FliK
MVLDNLLQINVDIKAAAGLVQTPAGKGLPADFAQKLSQIMSQNTAPAQESPAAAAPFELKNLVDGMNGALKEIKNLLPQTGLSRDEIQKLDLQDPDIQIMLEAVIQNLLAMLNQAKIPTLPLNPGAPLTGEQTAAAPGNQTPETLAQFFMVQTSITVTSVTAGNAASLPYQALTKIQELLAQVKTMGEMKRFVEQGILVLAAPGAGEINAPTESAPATPEAALLAAIGRMLEKIKQELSAPASSAAPAATETNTPPTSAAVPAGLLETAGSGTLQPLHIARIMHRAVQEIMAAARELKNAENKIKETVKTAVLPGTETADTKAITLEPALAQTAGEAKIPVTDKKAEAEELPDQLLKEIKAEPAPAAKTEAQTVVYTVSEDGQLLNREIRTDRAEDGLARTTAQNNSPITKQVLQQVAARLFLMSAEGHSVMRLQLKPDQLGQIKIQLENEGQTLTAKIQVENLQVKAMLEQNQQHLKDSLAQQGVKVSQFEVSVRQENRQTDFDRAWKESFRGTNRNRPEIPVEAAVAYGQDTGRRYGYNSIELVA